MNDIVKKYLHTPDKSALALENEKMQQYRERRKKFDNDKWEQMYER